MLAFWCRLANVRDPTMSPPSLEAEFCQLATALLQPQRALLGWYKLQILSVGEIKANTYASYSFFDQRISDAK